MTKHIAGMLLTLTLAIGTAAAQTPSRAAERDYSDAVVKAAEAKAKTTRDHFVMGEATQRDVAQAEYEVLETKYEAKQLTREDYCRAAPPYLQTVVDAIREEASIGQSTREDVTAAASRLDRIRALCRGV